MKLLIVNSTPGTKPVAEPDVTLVTDSSIVLPKNPLFIPDYAPEYVIEALPAVRISRLGKTISAKFAHRYYDAFTLLLRVLPVIDGKPARRGSAIYTAYDSAIIKGDWIETMPENDFTVTLGDKSCTASIPELNIDETISALSRYFSLKMGDIIAPCHFPLTHIPLPDTRLTAKVGDKEIINIKIK